MQSSPNKPDAEQVWQVVRYLMTFMKLQFPDKLLINDAAAQNTPESIFQRITLQRRKVKLTGKWWENNHGALLAFRKEDQTPVGLICLKKDEYLLYDAETKKEHKLTPSMAEDLAEEAWYFYRPLPGKKITWLEALKFLNLQSKVMWVRIAYLTLIITLISLLIPYAQSILITDILPDSTYTPIIWLTGFLLASTLVGASSSLVKNLLEQRLLGKYCHSFQSAIFDRLLNLPTEFFKQYSAGDLVMRALGVLQAQPLLNTFSINAVIALPCSVFLIGMIAWFSVKLALLAIVLMLFFLVVVSVTVRAMLYYTRRQEFLRGKTSGSLLQFFIGISTLQTTCSESTVFKLWLNKYAAQLDATFKAQSFGVAQQTFVTAFPLFCFLCLYAVGSSIITGKSNLSLGGFLAINSAFGALIGIMKTFAQSLLTLPSLIPLLERIEPILQTQPEMDESKVDCGSLSGEIEIRNLSFSYEPTTPWIFQNLNLTIKPGEFVALVGPSGEGKSTLLRLLLGFEQARAGSIFYDQKNIESLDVISIRRQMGVVIQNSKLLQGSVFENISGGLSYSEEEAWEAARLVGLAEQIKSFPMGMFTHVGENGNTLSGGQRQLLLLARALIRKPKIFMLDEATSQLDSESQAVVVQALQNMSITRIIIAHRLNTIQMADRILVLKDGQFAESGSYTELMAKNGVFCELVRQDLSFSGG